jgi:hypothetical protein
VALQNKNFKNSTNLMARTVVLAALTCINRSPDKQASDQQRGDELRFCVCGHLNASILWQSEITPNANRPT